MHRICFLLKYLNQKKIHDWVMLVKPCILFVAKKALGPQAAQKRECIPLFNDTVQRRIEDIATDVEEQVAEELLSRGSLFCNSTRRVN